MEEFEIEDQVDINFSLNEKYLGADLYRVIYPEVSSNITTYKINLSEGYNFFHLLSGEVFADALDTNYSIDLNQSKELLLSATAGSSIDVSDVIWQRQGYKLEGAWLKSFNNEPRDVKMLSRIIPGQTTFRFPFPGKGLSSIDLGWTGHSLENVSKDVWYTENTQNLREELTKLYWNNFPLNSSCDSIDIHQTKLIDSGAIASKHSKDADRIYYRPTVRDGNPDGIYNGEQQTSFLYDFDLTQIPVSEGENKIYFPISRISQESSDNVTKPNFQMNIDQCSPIKLSEINVAMDMAGAVASLDITKADMIFKKSGFCGSVNEAAWLSGSPISVGVCSNNSSHQSSLYSVFTPGLETRFVFHMTGGDGLTLNKVFYGLDHDPWCPYLKLEHIDYLKNSDRTKNLDYDQAKKCKCKATWFSPCGHSESFIKFWKFTDIIYLDPLSGFNEVRSFSPESWRDRNGKPWNDSDQIAYFEYSGIEPTIGWGRGNWRTGNGDVFYLKEGEVYVYRRTDINSCGTTPPLILNRSVEDSVCGYVNRNTPIWAKAIYVDGQFIDAGVPSDMILRSTDYIVYNHKPEYEFTCTKLSSRNVTSFNVSSTSSVELVPISSLGGIGSQLVSNILIKETEYSSVSVESDVISSFIYHKAPSFLWSTDLTNYNPRPYWALDPIEYCMDGQTSINEYDEYIVSTLPVPSNLVLEYDSYFSYQYQGNVPFVWNEDIKMRINENKPPVWMKIDISDYSMNTWENTTNQKSELKHPSVWSPPSENKFIMFSATTASSDMVLESRHNCGFWSEVVYCAKKPFTWTVVLTSESALQKNTPILDLYVKPNYPWRNAKNIYEAKFKIMSKNQKSKTKKSLGVLTPERTTQDILRGKDITIEYVGNNT